MQFGSAVLAAGASKLHIDMETEPSETQFSNGSNHAMATCYSQLYEEGEVEISTCPSHPVPLFNKEKAEVSRKGLHL